MNRWTIARSLHYAGLMWLRRRAKRYVSKDHRVARMDYCRWIGRCTNSYLKQLAFIDGTTFYLARGAEEKEDQRRRGLGPFVWRMATMKDGLFRDSVGASMYASKQGKPVKVWGFLSNGHLCLHVLPVDSEGKTTHMNGPAFRKMISQNGQAWKKACWPRNTPDVLHLIQDH